MGLGFWGWGLAALLICQTWVFPLSICARVSAELGGTTDPSDSFQIRFVSDTVEGQRKFIRELDQFSGQTNLRLRQALVRRDEAQILAHFDFGPVNEAIAREIKGLETQMSFSLFRHLYEKTHFGDLEDFLTGSWLASDVMYFAPGHGVPGAVQSIAGSLSLTGKDGGHTAISIRLPIRSIWEKVARTNAAKKAATIFYASCYAGVPGIAKDGSRIPSGAEQLARLTGKPVIAPLGALENLRFSSSEEVYTRVFVRNGEGREVGLGEDGAFIEYLPDGSSRPIRFRDVVSRVSRPEIKNEYINTGWNP